MLIVASPSKVTQLDSVADLRSGGGKARRSESWQRPGEKDAETIREREARTVFVARFLSVSLTLCDLLF